PGSEDARVKRFLRNRAAVLCAAIVLVVALLTIVGPWIAAGFGLDAVRQNAQLGATPPSAHHPLGADVLARDLIVRVLLGGRVALRGALRGAWLAVLLGVTWGAVAGLAGGRVDEVMMRIVDLLYSLPQIVFVMVVMAIAASRSEALLLGLIAGVSWLTMARIVRVEVLALRASPHLMA